MKYRTIQRSKRGGLKGFHALESIPLYCAVIRVYVDERPLYVPERQLINVNNFALPRAVTSADGRVCLNETWPQCSGFTLQHKGCFSFIPADKIDGNDAREC